MNELAFFDSLHLVFRVVGFFPKSGGSRLPVPKAGWAISFGSSLYSIGLRRGVAQSGQRICFGYRGP